MTSRARQRIRIPLGAEPCPALKRGSAIRSDEWHARVMANRPSGFEYELVGDDVVISHNGRRATTLRGATSDQFLAEVKDGDPQELMARATGNYKHGNERNAKNHPRNLSR